MNFLKKLWILQIEKIIDMNIKNSSRENIKLKAYFSWIYKIAFLQSFIDYAITLARRYYD